MFNRAVTFPDRGHLARPSVSTCRGQPSASAVEAGWSAGPGDVPGRPAVRGRGTDHRPDPDLRGLTPEQRAWCTTASTPRRPRSCWFTASSTTTPSSPCSTARCADGVSARLHLRLRPADPGHPNCRPSAGRGDREAGGQHRVRAHPRHRPQPRRPDRPLLCAAARRRCQVHTLITLATPHYGTELARPLRMLPLLDQLAPDSPVIRELAEPAPTAGPGSSRSTATLIMWCGRAETHGWTTRTCRSAMSVSGVGHLSMPNNGQVAFKISSALAELDPFETRRTPRPA